jgi:hypothetical protein
MKRHRSSTGPELGTITGIAEATAERVRLTGDLLKELVNSLVDNDKVQRRFRYAVLDRLSKIEITVTMIHSAQIVQAQGTKPGYEERIEEEVNAADEFISQKKDEVGLKMAKYLYGAAEEPGAGMGKRRSQPDWEI